MLDELPCDLAEVVRHARPVDWIELPVVANPPEWLAWDEAILDAAEAVQANDIDSGAGEALWFWESPTPFVVVGYGQNVEKEARITDCETLGIPVLRRCSGGGAVVQGPGCLNYGLVLRIPEAGPLTTIAGTNQWIMERQRAALSTLLDVPVVVRGHTDLALVRDGRELKFSGNAQRRKRRALLFHGTVLLQFDLPLIGRLLRTPSWAPEYRAGRSHLDFVANTGLKSREIQHGLAKTWSAGAGGRTLPVTSVQTLMESRYARPEWHRQR